MPAQVNSISELIIAVLPASVNLYDCDGSCGGDTCVAGCSGPASGCTNTSKGLDSAQCFDWLIDPAVLIELQNVLVSALVRTEELRIVNGERSSNEKMGELEKRFSAAVAAVRNR